MSDQARPHYGRTLAVLVGSAFAFDGTNDMVDVGSMPWLGTTTGLTVMAWIHRTNVANLFGGILGRWQATGASNSAAASTLV